MCLYIIVIVISAILQSLCSKKGNAMKIDGVIKLSVLDLISAVLQSGDLGSGFAGSARMTDAIKAHQEVQKSAGSDYTAEVPISYIIQSRGIDMEITGRIDGIIERNGSVTIDEIKTTTEEIENISEDYNPLHFAQAKCYACMYSILNGLDEISVQLTYYQMDTGEIKRFCRAYSFHELQGFFTDLIDNYVRWLDIIKNWSLKRDGSIRNLDFPFDSYRKGQRQFAVSVYKTIQCKGKLFAEAPTGTGKTIAAIYPAVKAIGEGLTSKLFYLTAKTTTRTVAEQAFEMMRVKGLSFKTVTITAKEKMCFNPGCECDPERCRYSRGYYDRIKTAVEDIFSVDSYTRPVIEEYARKHSVCPFELSLDLSLWADCIICDYNYVFDPRVYLKRFFLDNSGDYTFLIDEAHNMVDRCREMFSAELSKKQVLELKKVSKSVDVGIYRVLSDINSYMIAQRKECEGTGLGNSVRKEEPKEMYPLLKEFVKASEDFFMKSGDSIFRRQLTEFYFEASTFLRASEYYDQRFATYSEKAGNDVLLKIFCIDPSKILHKLLKRGSSAVFFSATFTPIEYFVDMLGGDQDSVKLRLASPFVKENLCLIINDAISTKYRNRELTYDEVVHSIFTLAKGKVGNYIAYFPSYKYLNEVIERFTNNYPTVNTIFQQPGATEEEREAFLKNFTDQNNETLVGFAVMGGVFAEGIDLAGDRLSGAAIVGVGLPQICLERDIIKDYFDGSKGTGFEYAYIYPGMNKVMQAVGRVIRTENDRGVVLMMDERFSLRTYEKLFPSHWNPLKSRNSTYVDKIINNFWNR